MYHFYFIYSKKADKYYIGYTSDLMERIKKHKAKHKGFTGSFNDWELVYSEEYETKFEAKAREAQVKKWKNRNRIESLIKRNSSA